MNGTPPRATKADLCTHCALASTLAASMLLPGDARAQTNACDQLKNTLSARFEASGVRGFSLEAVPADTPQPADARVIGNCEGGAYKVLYRRWGGAQPSAAAASKPAEPASAAQAAAPTTAAASRPSTNVQPPRDRAARSAAASAPGAASRAAARAGDGVASAPTAAQVREAEKAAVARASEVAAMPTNDPAALATPGAQDKDAAPTVTLTQRASAFIAAHWRWIGALVLLALAGGIWAWRAHRSAYDEAGLPRGPRL